MTVCIILSITFRVAGWSSDLSITWDSTCLNLSINPARVGTPPRAIGGVLMSMLEGVEVFWFSRKVARVRAALAEPGAISAVAKAFERQSDVALCAMSRHGGGWLGMLE